jgi:hypothetical protein
VVGDVVRDVFVVATLEGGLSFEQIEELIEVKALSVEVRVVSTYIWREPLVDVKGCEGLTMSFLDVAQ